MQRVSRIVQVFLVSVIVVAITASAQHAPVVPGADRVAEVEGAASASEGRVLMSELSCAACHDLPTVPFARTRSGPLLTNIHARISEEYLYDWLNEPHRTKSGTTMPDVIPDDAKRAATVDALVAYLSGQGVEPKIPDLKVIESELVHQGEALYHSVGCVACHDPFRPPSARIGSDDDFSESIVEHRKIQQPSVPLPDLAAKTNFAALSAFLFDPHSVRPSGRMPNMKLLPEEAKAIAAYLLNTGGAENQKPVRSNYQVDASLQIHGRELFSALRCSACHTVEARGVPSTVDIPIQQLDTGCLASERSSGSPWYRLSDRQRQSMRLALENAEPPTDARRLNEQLAALNCIACHQRGDLGKIEAGRIPYFAATIEADLGDEGRIPPPLTGVGGKLTHRGLSSMLLGDGSVRSYMATRMPRFGQEQVESLPTDFLRIDTDSGAPEMDVSGLLLHHRNRYGRQLVGTDGFACIGCHNLYGAKSLGIPAIDLATVPDRIQPSWFKRYLLDPSELRPGTRMPTFFEDGKSPITRVLSGNVDQQIEAMWIYLREIDQTRLPVGMEGTEDFELIPDERPIILRTFMKDVGTHAIAVGYPQGVHVAFDALHGRLALAWRGRFIDAESTWADRFSPFTSPLSEERFIFPEGPAVVMPEAEMQFRGYRLDDDGSPTFTYSLMTSNDTVQVEEHISIRDDGKILRRFSISGNRSTTLHLQRPQTDEEPVEIAPSSETTVIEQIWNPTW